MDTQERQHWIRQLSSKDIRDREEAAWILSRSHDMATIDAVLQIFEHSDDYPPGVTTALIPGLAEGAPDILEPVITHLDKSPFSPGGRLCAHVLGEVAYRQGVDRDPRIVPALLQTLKTTLPQGTWPAAAAVDALRQCVWAGPVPEAVTTISDVLSVANEEDDPYPATVDNALEVLYASKGGELLPELRVKIPNESPAFRVLLEEFIEKKEAEKENS